MAKAWEIFKGAVNVYVDFIQDWPGFVGILWPVTLFIAVWRF